MAEITLTFNVPDELVNKIVPSDYIYAEITTEYRTVYVTNRNSMTSGDWFQGFNAKLEVKEGN